MCKLNFTMNKKKSKRAAPSEEVMEGEENDLDKAEMDSMIAAQNKKKKKSGGFQSLGLANEVAELLHYVGPCLRCLEGNT